MPYIRISYDGYVEGEYKNKEEAVNDFIEIIESECDGHGCSWKNNLSIEIFNEKTQKWE